MVLGLRTKNRKGTSVQVDYLVHIQEIKPWPPSQSLRSLRSVLLQWENGDQISGSTCPVVPSLGSGIGDGKIEFNESFRLHVSLYRESSIKGGDADIFQKNCLEFNLYEPRRDKTVKGQLLGTVIVDLADYGIVKETVSVSAPMNCKRSFRNTAQPVLFFTIQPFDKDNSSSSSRASFSKEALVDKDGRESVSALMNGEYAEEAEIASFTDDDISSQSSLTITSSTVETAEGSSPQSVENRSEQMKDGIRRGNAETALPSEQVPTKPKLKPMTAAFKLLNGGSSCSSSIDLSSDIGSPVNDPSSLSNLHERSLISNQEKFVTHRKQSSSSFMVDEAREEQLSNSMRSLDQDGLALEVHEKVTNGISKNEELAQQAINEVITDSLAAEVTSSDSVLQVGEKSELACYANSPVNAEDNAQESRNSSVEATCSNSLVSGLMVDNDGNQQFTNEQKEQILQEKMHSTENEPLNKLSCDDTRKQFVLGSDTLAFNKRAPGVRGNTLTNDRLKHVRSVRSLIDTARSNGSANEYQYVGDGKECDFLEEDAHNGAKSFIPNGRKETKVVSRETRSSFSDSKILQLKRRTEMLEGELREAAAVEVSLYSIVAEHGSSTNKVHAPARRLSRFYLHAFKDKSSGRRASAARCAVSGLVLVAKACGNDVPRLTFWLSNSVVLRAIISQAVEDLQLPLSAEPHFETSNGGKQNGKKASPLKWKQSSPGKKEEKITESFDDWEDPHTFTTALEKCEAWIFSRIVESVWWQIMTPHMQSAAAKAGDRSIISSPRKICRRRSSLGDQEQERFSLDLWKKAFKDAFKKLCPVRAGGHECGCLALLARLVMEHCVDRLDVAMFNALLRESDDEIPTDPVSDPIGDSKVLPIPAGKSSFGAGALLKNTIGNWSRWLTDLFGIDDDDDSPEDENELDNNDRRESKTSFKAFHLLNALSDLMMLPKDMLLNKSIRKEVCPTFGGPLIKKILSNFVPDEFYPDPVPEVVFDALNSEDPFEDEEETITNFPCIAAPTAYSPPLAASLVDIRGEVGSQSQLSRSGSSVLRKSYTSDDELEELDSPLTSFVVLDTPKVNCGPNVLRYQLLLDVWKDSN